MPRSIQLRKMTSEHRTFTMAIADSNPLTRAGIRAIIESADMPVSLELAWESGSCGETLTELERSAPDLLVISLPECKPEHTTLVSYLSQRFPRCAKLLVSTPPKATDFCYRLLQAGLDGYVERNELAASFAIAVSSVLAGANWFSKCFTAMLVNGVTTPDAITVRNPSAQRFTRRQAEVVELMVMGRSNAEIAISLGLHQRTIRHHLRKVYDKLDVNSPSQAVLRVISGQVD